VSNNSMASYLVTTSSSIQKTEAKINRQMNSMKMFIYVQRIWDRNGHSFTNPFYGKNGKPSPLAT
jgi:hypothetical protein